MCKTQRFDAADTVWNGCPANHPPTSHLCWYLASSFSTMTHSPLPHFLATQLQCEAKEKLVWPSPPKHSECWGVVIWPSWPITGPTTRDKAGWSPSTGGFLLGLREEFLLTCSWSLRNSCHRSYAFYMKEAITKAYTLRGEKRGRKF